MASVADQPSLFARHDHAHLRLTAALPPARRRPRSSGAGPPRFPDHARHGADLRRQAEQIRLRHRRKSSVLGVDPDLVLVIELDRPIDSADLLPRGLAVLEATDASAMVAFSSDLDLTAFLRDVDRYAGGPTDDHKSPPLQGVFGAIIEVRELVPADIIDSDLSDDLLSCAQDELLRVDIECWCTEEAADARRRFSEMLQVVEQIGQIVDRSCRPTVGFSIIRADAPAEMVHQLAITTRVRRISRLPRPTLTQVEASTADVGSIPIVLSPGDRAPLIAIVDSGVRAEHPMLRAAVDVQLAVGSLDPTADAVGHGTMVAGLALYGSVERHINSHEPLRPAGRVISIRVLDDACLFPSDRIWQEDIARALKLAVQHGARVVNLSLGDDRHPYRPPGPVAVAAVVDQFAREHDLIVVISSGNLHNEALPRTPAIVDEYPRWLLGLDGCDLTPAADSGLAPPAMAALALTVGATVAERTQGVRAHRPVVDRRPMGSAGAISPLSRVGPGIEHSVKPELAAAGGSYCFDKGTGRAVSSPDTSVLGPGGTQPDQLLQWGVGTSFSAPLVSHAALRVLGRYPQLSANAVRALVLASAQPAEEVLAEGSTSEVAAAHRRLTGYGIADPERAESSSDHRAVLVADGSMQVDEVHFYTVPIPQAFFGPGQKWVRVALAHDPPVRPTRLRYLANKMSVFAYRGVPIDDVRRGYATQQENESDEPPSLADRHTILMEPSDQSRSRGANQLGVHRSQQAWAADLQGRNIVLAVRCTGRWHTGEPIQRYGLVVVLETNESAAELYAELRNQMRLLTEVEAEIEIG